MATAIPEPEPDREPAAGATTRLLATGSESGGSLGPMPGAAGTTGRFRVVREHARGGLGKVSVAVDAELNRPVALKEIHDHHADHEHHRSRFVAEAEITGRLEHAAIVPVYGLGRHADGRPYYAMRFVHGESLKEAIARYHAGPGRPGADPGPAAIALRELIGRFVDVCNAVAYAHGRGVIHRDLKPANVMLGPYGETFLVDWGLAKATGQAAGDHPAAGSPHDGPIEPADPAQGIDATAPGSRVGTPAFMSPEQAAGDLDRVGPASDGYGLGAILYNLLSGRPPIAGKSIGEVVDRARRGAIAPIRSIAPAVPRPLAAVCHKAMATRPEDRYASALDLARDVGRWLADEPVTAWPEPWPLRARRWARRHRVLVAAGSAALAVALLSAVAALATRRAEGLGLVDQLATAELSRVAALVERLEGHATWTRPRLRASLAASRPGSPERLRLSLGLLPHDTGQAGPLLDTLLTADAPTLLVIRSALGRHAREASLAKLRASLDDATLADPARFRAACALAEWAPDDPRWAALGPEAARELLAENHLDPVGVGDWAEALAPVMPKLVPVFVAAYVDPSRPAGDRALSGRLLKQHADRTSDLVTLIGAADDPADFDAFLAPLRDHPDAADALLAASQGPRDAADEARADAIDRAQAQCLIALARLGRVDSLWPRLAHSPDPSVRSWLIDRLGPLGYSPEHLIARFRTEPDVSTRRALVLALGQYSDSQLPPASRRALAAELLPLYRDHPDPGLHSAIDWLLTGWGMGDHIVAIDDVLSGRPRGDRNWFVNIQGQTFAVVEGPVTFTMGTATGVRSGLNPELFEPAHRRAIPRSFAIATKEVTVSQFRPYIPAAILARPDVRWFDRAVCPTDDCPINMVNWYGAMSYCGWLSATDLAGFGGLVAPPADGFATPPQKMLDSAGDGVGSVVLASGHLGRDGYRLPTESEWEYACRAGSSTTRPFGRGLALLPRYAWYQANSQEVTHPAGRSKPNDLGLFDALGSLREWCEDDARPYPAGDEVAPDRGAVGPIRDRSACIRRGGSFLDGPALLRSAGRDSDRPFQRTVSGGLRPARTMVD